jgi:hypothetical protein
MHCYTVVQNDKGLDSLLTFPYLWSNLVQFKIYNSVSFIFHDFAQKIEIRPQIQILLQGSNSGAEGGKFF